MHPADVEHVSEAIRRTLEEDDDYHVEYRIYSGRRAAWVEAVGRIERDADGMLQMTGVCMDVTERHRLEEDRRATHEMLGNLIATSPLGIVSLDRDGHVLVWNEAAETMYGWRADEVLGQPLPPCPGRLAGLGATSRRSSWAAPTTAAPRSSRRRRDGTPVTIALWTSPLRDADGEVVANVSLQADSPSASCSSASSRRRRASRRSASSPAGSRPTSTTCSR